MSLPSSLNDRQKNSYRPTGSGDDTMQAVEIIGDVDVLSSDTAPGLLSNINGSIIDAVTITDPTSVTRAYAYRMGGASGTVVKTVTVTYASASLKPVLDITQVVVV